MNHIKIILCALICSGCTKSPSAASRDEDQSNNSGQDTEIPISKASYRSGAFTSPDGETFEAKSAGIIESDVSKYLNEP